MSIKTGFDRLPNWYFSALAVFGRLWIDSKTGDLAPWARSAVSEWLARPAIMFAVLVVAALLPIPFLETQPLIAVTLFPIAIFFLWLLLARGTLARARAVSNQSKDAATAATTTLLEAAGFHVSAKSEVLVATRQLSAGNIIVEREWRALPQQLRIRFTEVDSGVESLVEGIAPAAHANAGHLREFCKAVAEVNGEAVSQLDRSILLSQEKGRLGVFAFRVSGIILFMTMITALLVATVVALVAVRTHKLVNTEFLISDHDKTAYQLVLAINADLDEKMQLVTTGITEADGKWTIGSDNLNQLRLAGVKGEIVIALVRPNDFQLVLPTKDSALYPFLTKDLVAGPGGVKRVGDKIFVRRTPRASHSAYTDLRKRLSREDVGDVRLVVGAVLTKEEFASFLPWSSTLNEITFFHDGKVAAKIEFTAEVLADGRFGGPRVSVTQPEIRVPDAAVRASLDRSDATPLNSASLYWKAMLFGAIDEPYGIVRQSNGRDSIRTVYIPYSSMRDAGVGWSGIAIPLNDWAVETSDESLLHHALELALVFGLIVFAMSGITSNAIARRLSKPLIETRNAMQHIAGGDYSVRITQSETDEIGQLQEHLNRMAEDLQKREAIRELMGKYLSKQVADKILEGDGTNSLSGIRREITVLFADVRGFTTYSENHDPEQVTNSLNEYFEVMVEIIASHEGVLDKYIGDGLMVVFGAPVLQPDHARRAVDTALEMQAAIKTLNLKRAQRGDVPIDIGIGINTGMAISGNLGSIKRMEFTVIGDTVNTAARLESRAEKGQILIGKGTYEKVAELVDTESMGEITVKGKNVPIEVWGLKGLKLRTV